jgi:uncharacterized protein
MSIRGMDVQLRRAVAAALPLVYGSVKGALGIWPGVCRYEPSCSEYAREAIVRYGIGRGMVRAALRVMRCHPWSKGGWDPVESDEMEGANSE